LCAAGGVEAGGFACAAAAASFAASTDGSGLLDGATLGGFALGDTENGSERTGGNELTIGGGTGVFGAAGCAGAGVFGAAAGTDEDGRGGAGVEGPTFVVAPGVARGTSPDARRAPRPADGGPPEGRGAAAGAAGGNDDAGRGATGTGDGAAAGDEDSGLSDDGTINAGVVRGSAPKMSSSSPQPESTFCSSFLSGTAGAGLLGRGTTLGAAGDASHAESNVSLSAVLSGGDSASFMSASNGENCRTNEAMVRRAGAL